MQSYVDTLDPSGEPWIAKPTAPMNADLYLLGKRMYGDAWAQDVMEQLPKP